MLVEKERGEDAAKWIGGKERKGRKSKIGRSKCTDGRTSWRRDDEENSS